MYYHHTVVSDDNVISIVNPLLLVGLKQAVYVMGCLVRHDDENEIVRELSGDKQLFDMWKSFET